MLLPAALFLFYGAVDDFGRRSTDFPTVAEALAPAPEARQRISDAIFDRSLARLLAIRLRNRAELGMFGSFENDRVVSGEEGWLFYKNQFNAWDCRRHKRLQLGIERLTLLVDMAEAGGLPVLFVSVPNKATAVPELTQGRAEKFMPCYLRFSETYGQALVKLAGSHLVNHRELLDGWDRSQPSYLKLDTHWTEEFGALALNQLFEQQPVVGSVLHNFETMSRWRVGDLSNMLQLGWGEMEPVVSSSKVADAAALNILFLQDSFYNRLMSYINDRSPGVEIRHIKTLGSLGRSLRKADFVVVSSVEREILDRVLSRDGLGWGGTFGNWFLQQSAMSAADCHWDQSLDLLHDQDSVAIELRNLRAIKAGLWRSSGQRSQVTIRPFKYADGKAICLRIELESSIASRLTLSLSDPGIQSDWFGEGRRIAIDIKPGINQVAVVLPAGAGGRAMRLELIQGEGDFRVRRFELAPR